MKCICGYQRDWQWDDNGDVIQIGEEEFIRLQNTFDDSEEDYRFKLYICPKCGTVRAEKHY